MPWWNRLLGEPSPEEQSRSSTDFSGLDAALAQARPLVGGPVAGSCSSPGCGETEVWPCAYTDAGGNACATRWCQVHLSLLEGRAHCADHAATVLALGDRPATTPAVTNRSPALAEWLSRRVAPVILTALEEGRDQFAEAIVSDPVQPREEDGRRWRRTWRLFDGAASTLTVGIEVDEAEPPRVRGLVGTEVVVEARCGAAGEERERVARVLEDALRAGITGQRPRAEPATG